MLEDYGNNIVQAKDNNANGIDEMASILWDIIASCESKHVWQQANKTWVDNMEWSYIGGLLFVNKKSLIVN